MIKPNHSTQAKLAAPKPIPIPKPEAAAAAAAAAVLEDAKLANFVTSGDASSLMNVMRFADFKQLDAKEVLASLRRGGEAVNRGDLAAAERMLNNQAIALDVMFSELAGRAAANMGKHLPAMETYLRLALKAQSQSRATLETLAAIKSPPVVFARQANINNGGQQQVNNGAVSPPRDQPTHTEQTVFKPNELLEDATHGRTQLDTRATPAAGRAHQDLAAVGAVNRATNR